LVVERLARAVDQEAAGQAALGEAEVRAGGQRDGRSPPGVIHQVQGGPGVLAGHDGVAGVPGGARRPFGADRRALVAPPHLAVALEAARGQHDAAARRDDRGLAITYDPGPGDAAAGHLQAGQRRVQPDRHLRGHEARPQPGGERLAHAEGVLP